MRHLVHADHPFRIFAISSLITVGALVAALYLGGGKTAFLMLVLIAVEVTFSFDNAIINARVLMTMSKFWQQMFITVGMMIAVFGMRLVFPILVVMITAGMPWDEVLRLALNDPDKYSHQLHDAHVSIASFGGMFLLMLCLHFFFDPKRDIRWIDIIERPLQRIGKWWIYTGVSVLVLMAVAALPFNPDPHSTIMAGAFGIITYIVVHGLAELFTARQEKSEKLSGKKAVQRAGMAGFMSFLYLEILDASFSFDGVIGAFAVTKDVILIAAGLGIGALWVRSLTIFMVRKHVLGAYRYLEHGAHYTIGMLAGVLLTGIFVDIPEFIAGLLGIGIIAASIVSSIIATRREESSDGSPR